MKTINITDDDAGMVAKIMGVDASDFYTDQFKKYGDFATTGRAYVDYIFNSGERVWMPIDMGIRIIKVTDYLRSKGYNIPNQYSTPSASVEWDKIEMDEVIGCFESDEIVGAMKLIRVLSEKYSFHPIKHHFKPADMVGEWIMCSQRLPELNTWILVWREDFEKPEISYVDEYWMGCLELNDYTHWQLMPQKPKIC